MGALPTLRAATDPGVLGGQYYGPRGFFGTRGYPKTGPTPAGNHRRVIYPARYGAPAAAG